MVNPLNSVTQLRAVGTAWSQTNAFNDDCRNTRTSCLKQPKFTADVVAKAISGARATFSPSFESERKWQASIPLLNNGRDDRMGADESKGDDGAAAASAETAAAIVSTVANLSVVVLPCDSDQSDTSEADIWK
jgi:hypothetical protein